MIFARSYPEYPEFFKTNKPSPFKDQQDLEIAQKAAAILGPVPIMFNFSLVPQIPELGVKLQRGIKVLDVGCGLGENLIFNAKLFPKCQFMGIDNHEISVREAKNRVRGYGLEDKIAIELMDAENLNFREEFDLIMFVFTLHEIFPQQREKVLRNCYNALRKGGMIFRFEDTYPEKMEDLRREEWSLPIMHQWYEAILGSRIISRSEREQMLLKTGFREAKTFTSNMLPEWYQDSAVATVGKK